MDADRYLTHLRSDGNRLAEVAEQGLDPDVPACPGWTVRDVVTHTARVYTHKIACIRQNRAPDPWPPPDIEEREQDPLEFFRSSLAELVDELTSRGPAAPAYTWWQPEQTVGFWDRRMAQETVVHRVDVEAAHDLLLPVDEDLALDGIDEVLERFLAGPFGQESIGELPGGTAVVRSGDHAWLVRMDPDANVCEAGPGAADATVTGEPSELLLWLWGRRPDSAVHAQGDSAAVRALRDRLAAATQ
jgi:uncharacterized protein (TIGR03083 family)